MNYLDGFERTVRCDGGDTAVVTADGAERTYDELDRESTAFANAVHERIPDARCGTLARNGVETIASMIAGQKRGRGTVQLPFRAGADELVRMLDDADADGILFDDANADLALDVVERAGLEFAVHAGDASLDDGRAVSYEEFVADAPADAVVERADTDEYGVFYTSGTTSRPKAVRFDQESMWLGATQVVMEMSIEPSDVALVTTPWYHMVTSDAWILPHLLTGATLVLQPTFEPDEALELVAAHDVTGMLAVPTQLDVLAERQAELDLDVETLDYIRTGGAVVSASLVERAAEHLTETVYNSYGMTEGGPNLAYAHPEVQDEHTGSVGRESYAWELRVVDSVPPDEDPNPDAIVGPGGTGEILARCEGMCDGYLNDPEAEDDLFVDGWLRTHDVADVDEGGYLYIVDRVDNMILSGGENVYPQEVEQVLLEHGSVNDVGVVGLDDDHWGEVVAAVVSANDDVAADDLDQFCVAHRSLANFKRPRQYVVTTDDLPRTDTGTLERATVKERFFSAVRDGGSRAEGENTT
ncbi:long-chain-fatty-acid--CoA ligase [Halarchaeum acidiphilum MH1-52-1]|uniref:Long-chain-fatty-acid--CoA ligase n=1 Tax=Halarchaeum acidiphilum MH1-52-1 TaxID=1261545 RepID=U3A860_9EURY|nr:class I adenylate-forming enzyme family protein [Halarchaeum acidiphilum]GAD53839.1 long-chain-fatty-acid--CoA ligase [Halarchaeum acidiphilum MH1-52-1]